MEKEYEVTAKEDMHTTEGHNWIKGNLYQVTERKYDFALESEEAEIHYVNAVKKDVLSMFTVQGKK